MLNLIEQATGSLAKSLQQILSRADPLHPFSWLLFCAEILVYSLLTFTGVVWKQGASVFSKQNAKSPRTVLNIHVRFVLIQLAALWLVSAGFPHFPPWMTDTVTLRGANITYCDLLFIVFMVALFLIERSLIYAEAGKQASIE